MPSTGPQPDRRDHDVRWSPGTYPREVLLRAILAGRMAGDVSHPLDNVLWKIGRLCEGDPDLLFGLSGLESFGPRGVLELVGAACGFSPDPALRSGPVHVDPQRVLRACEEVGDRLASA